MRLDSLEGAALKKEMQQLVDEWWKSWRYEDPDADDLVRRLVTWIEENRK